MAGWCLQFVGSSKIAKQKKKPAYDMQLEVLEQDEQRVYQPIRR